MQTSHKHAVRMMAQRMAWDNSRMARRCLEGSLLEGTDWEQGPDRQRRPPCKQHNLRVSSLKPSESHTSKDAIMSI